jgi:ATP-dependent exoDNAse (exonuclease V) alpha subunit
LGVSNGDLGTVKRIELISQRMIVRLDDGREATLPYREFDAISLGYAITTHKGQGATVKNAFVLCGGAMANREISYVQASRAKKETHFFTERIEVWDAQAEAKVERTFEELARRMSVSGQKDMALDVGRTRLTEERERPRELVREW